VTPDEAFRELTQGEQVRLLIRLVRELTLVARHYYTPGTDQLGDPVAVRMVNEIQHRVAAQAENCFAGADRDAPVGYGFVADCWDHNGLRELVQAAFARAYKSVRPQVATVA
jgi:hypothetical protein